MEQSSSIPNYMPLPPKNPSISEQNPVNSDISYQNITPLAQSNDKESLNNLFNNNVDNSVNNSGNATMPLYSTSVYTPPSVFSNADYSLSQPAAILPTMTAQSAAPVPVMDQNLPFISPPVPQPQPIYCSDGIVYSNEIESDNNDLTLPDNLVDIYRNLGIVGRILTGGSLVTIRFIQMFRNLSESLVDALGIARPKYEAEINAYAEMKQEEQQHQAEIQQMYGTWRPTNNDPSNAFNQQPIMSMNSEIMPQVPSNIQPAPPPPPPPPSTVNMNFQAPNS